jgi:hypothetical protein
VPFEHDLVFAHLGDDALDKQYFSEVLFASGVLVFHECPRQFTRGQVLGRASLCRCIDCLLTVMLLGTERYHRRDDANEQKSDKDPNGKQLQQVHPTSRLR